MLYDRERIRAEGLQDRCTVELCDYRDLPGTGVFDKIASVGMFEHVGLKNLPAYFGKIRSLLKPEGLVLNHGITTSDIDSRWAGLGAGEFIDRYVFPDGELPHLALVLKEISAAGLEATDVESLRRHYARTCREWTDRLQSNLGRAVEVAGGRRVRIWQIYLAGCAYGFAKGWMNLYQVLACTAENTGAKPCLSHANTCTPGRRGRGIARQTFLVIHRQRQRLTVTTASGRAVWTGHPARNAPSQT